jgi:hypothetical protein
MILFVACPNCRHVGATTAALPRALVCSQSARVTEGELVRSPIRMREERIAQGSGLNQ